MNKEEIISSGLLELYVSGAASAEERAEVERWRANDPEIAAIINEIELSMEDYAMSNAIKPSPSVKASLFATINAAGSPSNQTTSAPAKTVSMFPWRTVAAAAILLLITSTVFNYNYYNRYKEAADNQRHSEEQLALLQKRADDMNNDMNIVRSKYSLPVSLHGLEAAPDAGAKIFWMKNTGEVYVDPGNLPMAPNGMQYQLWAIVDGKPVDGGMITTNDGKKYSIQKMKTFGKAQAFAITLETAGGHPTPQGKMYVMGEI